MKKASVLVAAALVAAMGIRAQDQTAKKPVVRVDVKLKPILFIEMGAGALEPDKEFGDVVDFSYNTPEAYTNGLEKRVDRQLRVISVGASGYTVDAEVSKLKRTSGSGKDEVSAGELLELAVTERGGEMHPKAADSKTKSLYSTPSEGIQELDVLYKSKPLIGNTDMLTKLMGEDRKLSTYVVDIMYSVMAN